MSRFEIRALLPGDEDQLYRVAKHLNSVNLPNDKARIEEIVELSHKSFAGLIASMYCRTAKRIWSLALSSTSADSTESWRNFEYAM